MDMKALESVHKLTLSEARDAAKSLISAKTKKLTRFRLERDIERARSAAEVAKIAHNIYLSGNGLGVVGSGWNKNYY